MKTKIIKAAGRYGVRGGQMARRKIAEVEERQRKKQMCLFCNGRAKRTSKGIWKCGKCGKKFASHSYYLEQAASEEKNESSLRTAKPLKKENSTMNKETK